MNFLLTETAKPAAVSFQKPLLNSARRLQTGFGGLEVFTVKKKEVVFTSTLSTLD